MSEQMKECGRTKCANCQRLMVERSSKLSDDWMDEETGESLTNSQWSPLDRSTEIYCTRKCYLEGMFNAASDDEKAGIVRLVRSIQNVHEDLHRTKELREMWDVANVYHVEREIGYIDDDLNGGKSHRVKAPSYYHCDETAFVIPKEAREAIARSISSLLYTSGCMALYEMKHGSRDYTAREAGRAVASAAAIELALREGDWE